MSHTSYGHDDAAIKAMFKAPPRSQIGTSIQHEDSTVKPSKAGVAASNLLHKKGVVVGGGGIIGQKPPPFVVTN